MKNEEATHCGFRLIFNEFGNPEQVLRFENRCGIPQIFDDHHVLVRILAAPINPADLNMIEGAYGVKPPLPATPGIEGCGVVELSHSPDFNLGDLVIFMDRGATWASHVVVPADSLFKLPPAIDILQAAMLKVNPATAWRLLHGFATVKNGEWIVQNVGNSAVGRCVIQLARDLGIRTISFVRRLEISKELRDLGADHVFCDDESGHSAARDVLGDTRAVLAFNAVGGESALRLMKLLREGGIHITYGAMGRKPLTIPNGLLIFRDIQVRGLWVTRWIQNTPRAEVNAVYENLAVRITSGKLVQPVDSKFSFNAFSAALERLHATERAGKVLFVPSMNAHFRGP